LDIYVKCKITFLTYSFLSINFWIFSRAFKQFELCWWLLNFQKNIIIESILIKYVFLTLFFVYDILVKDKSYNVSTILKIAKLIYLKT